MSEVGYETRDVRAGKGFEYQRPFMTEGEKGNVTLERGPDWAEKCRRASRRYVFIGFAIGVLYALVSIAIFSVLIRVRTFDAYWVYPVGFALGFLIVYPASKGTCKVHPAAPTRISMGLAVGAGVMLLMFVSPSSWRSGWHSWNVSTVSAIGLVIGGYVGGKHGLRENLGRKQKGLGATCASCGYDLRDSAAQVPCPECNETMRYEWSPESLK